MKAFDRASLHLGFVLGYQDVKQSYRRSKIGQFWITLGIAVQIGTMGFVFSQIFRNDSGTYIPFLAVSIILWNFLSGALTEGCFAFINSEHIIRQIQKPFTTYLVRTIWKALVTLGHNLVILPVVYLVFQVPLTQNFFLVIPGLALVSLNLLWIMSVTATISARYRDFPPIVAAVVTIFFYVTPVIWQPNLLSESLAHLLLGLNPLYHLLQIVRLPLLGEAPTLQNWTIALAALLIGSSLAWLISRKFGSRIGLWL